MSAGLTAGAETRVEEINGLGQDGVLINYTRPDGTNFSTVLNGRYHSYAENLDGGAETPNDVINDWYNSPEHYNNLFNPNYQKLGVGYLYDDSDPSDHRWYWTQLFADSLNAVDSVSTANLLTANIRTCVHSRKVV